MYIVKYEIDSCIWGLKDILKESKLYNINIYRLKCLYIDLSCVEIDG